MTGLILLLLALIGGLTPDAPLMAAAQARSDDMVTQEYFGHALYAYPAGYCGIGELLARTGPDTTAEAVLDMWKRSPSHAFVLDTLRANRAGLGRSVGEDGTTIWTLALARTC